MAKRVPASGVAIKQAEKLVIAEDASPEQICKGIHALSTCAGVLRSDGIQKAAL
jgi:hypothetical protein